MALIKGHIQKNKDGSYRFSAGNAEIALNDVPLPPVHAYWWDGTWIVLYDYTLKTSLNNLSGYSSDGALLWTAQGQVNRYGRICPWDALWKPWLDREILYFSEDSEHGFELLDPKTGRYREVGHSEKQLNLVKADIRKVTDVSYRSGAGSTKFVIAWLQQGPGQYDGSTADQTNPWA